MQYFTAAFLVCYLVPVCLGHLHLLTLSDRHVFFIFSAYISLFDSYRRAGRLVLVLENNLTFFGRFRSGLRQWPAVWSREGWRGETSDLSLTKISCFAPSFTLVSYLPCVAHCFLFLRNNMSARQTKQKGAAKPQSRSSRAGLQVQLALFPCVSRAPSSYT